jgi:hypothetical protein
LVQTSLPRPCEKFAAGGAKACGGREKGLRRAPKNMVLFVDYFVNEK